MKVRPVGGKVRHCIKVLCVVGVFTCLTLYSIATDDDTFLSTTPNGFHTGITRFCANNATGADDPGYPCNKPLHRENGVNYLVYEKGCRLMDMDPFHLDVKKYWKKPKIRKCEKALVKAISGTQTITMNLSSSWKFAQSSCCYRQITRVTQNPNMYDNKADMQVKISKTCTSIPQDDPVEVPPPTEFLKIECKNGLGLKTYEGFDAIVQPPSRFTKATAEKAAFWEEQFIQKNKTLPPSVIVVGIDSISRLHMYRSLPKTKTFLQSNDFVELLGYTKVGDNTFPNIMAGFAGRDPSLLKECWKARNDKVDSCNHIWKNFSSLNYLTGFMEDAPGIAIFNYLKTGFVLPPADYYLRPLMVADLQFHKRKYDTAASSCMRGNSPTSFVSAYFKDLANQVASKYPSFLFSWFTDAGHDDFNLLKMYDKEMENLLEVIITAAGDNSIILFISDHGYRFGNFRETFLGYYEESLPFFFLRMPPTLKETHPEWYENLRINTNKLTTPFDLYETLKDILQLAEESTSSAGLDTNTELPMSSPVYASSFFAVGRTNRTCEDSGVPQRYCMCGVTPHLFKDTTLIKQFGDVIVQRLNAIINERNGSSQCAHLNYNKHVYVREVGNGEKWNNLGKIQNYKDYVMALEVSPGEGHFESRIRLWENGLKVLEGGDVSRTNSYAGKSDCVTKDSVLRNYCMCKDILERQKKKEHKKNG